MWLFKKKVKVATDEPNPMLEVEHDHDWLSASSGTEWVCGLCGKRRPA